MSIKIDLLPGYIRLRKIFKRWLQIGLASLALTGGLLYAINTRQQQKLQVVTANATALNARATEIEKINTDAQTVSDALGATRSANGFFVDASKTGAQRAALLDQVRRYIYGRVQVQSLDLGTTDGSTVRMKVSIPTPDDYAEFIRQIRFAELDGFFVPGSAKGSGIPTYNNGVPSESTSANAPGSGAPGFGVSRGGPPNGQPLVQQTSTGPEQRSFPIVANIDARLVTPVTVPIPPGVAAPAAGAGTGGPPGSFSSGPSSGSSSSGSRP